MKKCTMALGTRRSTITTMKIELATAKAPTIGGSKSTCPMDYEMQMIIAKMDVKDLQMDMKDPHRAPTDGTPRQLSFLRATSARAAVDCKGRATLVAHVTYQHVARVLASNINTRVLHSRQPVKL